MKAYPLLILSILVAGCASNPTAMEPKPAPDFRRPLQNTLYVEFLGDSQSIGLVAYANNPRWKCSLCQPQLTSVEALALIPQLLALKPDVVHIMVGAYELDYESAEPDDELQDAAQVANSIQLMLTQLEATKMPVVVGNQPPCADPTVFDGVEDDAYAIADFNNLLTSLFSQPAAYPWTIGVPTIDYYDIGPEATVCGAFPSPNAAGYARMLPLTEAAIDKLQASGLK